RARVLDRHVLNALLVDQPAQLAVDLAGGQVVRVEHGRLAVDLRDLGDRAVELYESARVVQELLLRVVCGYLVHTITSLSYGSYVSISRSTTLRIAISSEASATMSSDS